MLTSFIGTHAPSLVRLSTNSSSSYLFRPAHRICVQQWRKRFPSTIGNVIHHTTSHPVLPATSIRMTSSSSPPPPPPQTDNSNAGPTMVRAKHILVDSEDLIDTVRAEIEGGKKSFSEIAKLVSTCPSKDRGGDLGWFRRDAMVKEFEEAAFSNPPGSVIKVKTEFGWHLIRVEDHAMAASSITVQEFAMRFVNEKQEGQFIDCREKGELELASITNPPFLNLPMGEFEEWAEDFETGKLNLQKDKETIVMCHHGMRSANFCSFLSQQGFRNVRNLEGGIHEFSTQVDSSIPKYGN